MLRIWLLLVGLTVLLIAFMLAGASMTLADAGLHLKAVWAGELFTIPLAASVDV